VAMLNYAGEVGEAGNSYTALFAAAAVFRVKGVTTNVQNLGAPDT